MNTGYRDKLKTLKTKSQLLRPYIHGVVLLKAAFHFFWWCGFWFDMISHPISSTWLIHIFAKNLPTSHLKMMMLDDDHIYANESEHMICHKPWKCAIHAPAQQVPGLPSRGVLVNVFRALDFFDYMRARWFADCPGNTYIRVAAYRWDAALISFHWCANSSRRLLAADFGICVLLFRRKNAASPADFYIFHEILFRHGRVQTQLFLDGCSRYAPAIIFIGLIFETGVLLYTYAHAWRYVDAHWRAMLKEHSALSILLKGGVILLAYFWFPILYRDFDDDIMMFPECIFYF